MRGTVGLARWMRVSPGVVAATIAAFGTSSPELTVSVTAAIAGAPQIALGDALGSNVANIALIFGIVLLIAKVECARDAIRRDFFAALLIPPLIGLLALDGLLSRMDGVLLLGMFALWIIAVLVDARKQRNAARPVGEHRGWPAVTATVVGLAFLVAAGRLIVSGAKEIAVALDLDQFVIGATVVAVGTSVPEIATAVIAKLRGHDEIGLGTLLGSNVFNGLFIVAVASMIAPIAIAPLEIVSGLAFGFVAVAIAFPAPNGLIQRERGFLLLGIYGAFLFVMMRYAPSL